METIDINDCTLDLLENKFGLRCTEYSAVLHQWVTTNCELNHEDVPIVRRLSAILRTNSLH